MLPITHKLISEHIHRNVLDTLGVELNKSSLIYGSVKPDIAPKLLMMDHFKPQSYDIVMDEIHNLSQFKLIDNKQFLRFYSTQVGVVTHFIADFFCVPHNDRRTYKNNFKDHFKYESDLHKELKAFNESVKVSYNSFNVDNLTPFTIKKVIDHYHREYSLLEESPINDIKCSLLAATAVTLYIIHNSMKTPYIREIA